MQELLENLHKTFRIGNYKINSDNTVDVDGDVSFLNMNLSEIPIKFRYVSGKFNVSGNNLTSLKNSPLKCKSFYCSYNKNLTSLEYCPTEVEDEFYFTFTSVKSLDYLPKNLKNVSLYYTKVDLTNIKDSDIGSGDVWHDNNFEMKRDGILNKKRKLSEAQLNNLRSRNKQVTNNI